MYTVFITDEQTNTLEKAHVSRYCLSSMLSESERKEGIEVISIPQLPSEAMFGKMLSLYVNQQTKEVWYEYIDRPLTAEEELETLKSQNEVLGQTLANLTLQNADLVTQVQTLSQTVAEMQLGGM